MDALFPFLTPLSFVVALCIAFCAGFVKGVVGFALPLVLISGLTLFLAPEIALAGLILPGLFANIMQATRQGPRAAWQTVSGFRPFLIAGGVTLVISAQLVRAVPEPALQIAIGIPAVVYSLMQLTGFEFSLEKPSIKIEALFGSIAGTMAGFSGVWAPPTVMYLTALGTLKQDQMRIQGVIYGAGGVALVVAHTGSGVLRAETLPFSLSMIVPALFGMWAGSKVIDRIDQSMFKRVTLIVLLIAGANLIRRGLF